MFALGIVVSFNKQRILQWQASRTHDLHHGHEEETKAASQTTDTDDRD